MSGFANGHSGKNFVRDRTGAHVPTEFHRTEGTCRKAPFNGLFDALRGVFELRVAGPFGQIVEHQRSREDRSQRICLVLAHDVRRRAVGGLEEADLVSNPGASRHAHAANEA